MDPRETWNRIDVAVFLAYFVTFDDLVAPQARAPASRRAFADAGPQVHGGIGTCDKSADLAVVQREEESVPCKTKLVQLETNG